MSPIFQNDYAPNGKAIRAQARAEAGHRCIRCGHPYKCGIKRPDRGEWSDCDEQCTHGGVIRIAEGSGRQWKTFAQNNSRTPQLLLSQRANLGVQARWRVLTVHHFDGDKANDAWWNLLALCQVCHLSFQTRVNPEIPWMFEHSDWLKPYVAGFYALKYLGKQLTREEVMERLDELLAYENRIGSGVCA